MNPISNSVLIVRAKDAIIATVMESRAIQSDRYTLTMGDQAVHITLYTLDGSQLDPKIVGSIEETLWRLLWGHKTHAYDIKYVEVNE